MSRSPITFRLSEMREAEIREYLSRVKKNRPHWGDYTMSDFIKDAIDQKLAHLERSRKAARKRTKKFAGLKEVPVDQLPFEPDPPSEPPFQTVWGTL